MARAELYPPSVDPRFPELPPTPPGWIHTTFGDIVEVVERRVRLESDESYQLVTAKRNRGGITRRAELLGREILTKTQFQAREGDFLISRRQIIHGACGVVPAALDGAIVSNEYSTLKARPLLLMDFLRHYSHAAYFQRTCFHSSHGVDVEKMIFKIDEWLAREVNLPPVGEQRKVAAILNAVDDAIEASQAVIEQLQVTRRELAGDLLTRGLPGRHAAFKLTEIGEVPESWDVRPLGELGRVGNGSTPSRNRSDYWEGGTIPWLPTGKVNDRNVIAAEQFVTEKALAECSIRLLPPGTLLVAMIGQGRTRGLVAHLSIAATINQNFAYISLGPRCLPWFVFGFIDHHYITLRAAGRGSNQGALNCAILKAFHVPVPPLDEQREIAAALGLFDARIEAESGEGASLRHLKAALLSVLLTGELRVTPDAPAP